MKNWIALLLGTLILTGCGAQGARGPTSAPPPGPAENVTDETAVPFTKDLVAGGERIESRVYKPQGKLSGRGIVFVSGVDGDFIEPADGIYDRIARAELERGVASVFVKYRYAGGYLESSVTDALAGVNYLRSLGVKRMALIGWSFGGAVVSNTAPQVPEVTTIVGFALQSALTEPIANYHGHSILILHSQEDENVPFTAAQQILDDVPAGVKKKLVPLEHGDHHFDGMSDEVFPTVETWLEHEL